MINQITYFLFVTKLEVDWNRTLHSLTKKQCFILQFRYYIWKDSKDRNQYEYNLKFGGSEECFYYYLNYTTRTN